MDLTGRLYRAKGILKHKDGEQTHTLKQEFLKRKVTQNIQNKTAECKNCCYQITQHIQTEILGEEKCEEIILEILTLVTGKKPKF